MKRKTTIFFLITGALLAPVLFSPLPGFRTPYSTVVEASDGSLLGARIADDGQWRFAPGGEVPDKFAKALLTYEDNYFYWHPGINPVSLGRALLLNIKAKKIVSGGSTITMQVARLARGNTKRTYLAKLGEMLSALKLELFRSKKKILEIYAGNAPFGGNVVGLEAATRKYYSKPASEITWAEAAALAVLPNAPSLVFPGRNEEIFRTKRDKLLNTLYKKEIIDSLTLILSIDEPLPGAMKPIPSLAPHLTDHYFINKRGTTVKTTIDASLQAGASSVLLSHVKILSGNFINNACCIILDVNSGEVLAYVGNATADSSRDAGGDVDVIRARRSSGSILKPLLYAAMQSSGELLPNSMVADIPTKFQGFTPENFDRSYSGAVPASQALSQSLNIPAVKMLQTYTPERFLSILRGTGFTTFEQPADHYGLSLILGGGEVSLWELAGAYASLSRVLNRFGKEETYLRSDYHPPLLLQNDSTAEDVNPDPEPLLPAGAIWLTYEALRQVNRPENQSGWQFFSSTRQLAWKTGTSFGFRDAWALGTTPEYVIAVWAGNAGGEGRPGLTGLACAAPILFDLVNLMEQGSWFERPSKELTTISVCSKSGFRAGPDCSETKEADVYLNGLRSDMCPWHRVIHLNSEGTRQVNAGCYPAGQIKNESWFVLTPAMEYFYKQKNASYKSLPPWLKGCQPDRQLSAMEFIYPSSGAQIFIPRDQTGELTRVIAEVVHRDPRQKIYWHLDKEFLETTNFRHQVELLASEGRHTLTAVDDEGNTISCSFSIIRSFASLQGDNQ